jgi:hypothetical protein
MNDGLDEQLDIFLIALLSTPPPACNQEVLQIGVSRKFIDIVDGQPALTSSGLVRARALLRETLRQSSQHAEGRRTSSGRFFGQLVC